MAGLDVRFAAAACNCGCLRTMRPCVATCGDPQRFGKFWAHRVAATPGNQKSPQLAAFSLWEIARGWRDPPVQISGVGGADGNQLTDGCVSCRRDTVFMPRLVLMTQV